MKRYDRYYFIGIGGIGMSALARYFKALGAEVAGYDKTPSALTAELEKEGIAISFTDALAEVPEAFQVNLDQVLICYTPAVPFDNSILQYFKTHAQRIIKRSQLLAEVASAKRCIAIAGTHGKTTTTSILAHLLHAGGVGCTAFVGGVMPAYKSNVIIDHESDLVVLEADEFDRSFHHLSPELAVITSTDADHLDIYGDEKTFFKAFQDFSERVIPGGKLYRHGSTIPFLTAQAQVQQYGIDEGDIRAENVHVADGRFRFDGVFPQGSIAGLSLSLPGRHNVDNALAASAIALELGLPLQSLKPTLDSYQGVKRRFEFIVETPSRVYIDDYAHHPSEIDASIASARELFPGKKLLVVFQPHLFSRTRDFMSGFARSLSQADELVLLPIYPARELPIEGVTSEALLEQCTATNSCVCEKEALPQLIGAAHFEVLLTLGAGDIDRMIEPLRKLLLVDHS